MYVYEQRRKEVAGVSNSRTTGGLRSSQHRSSVLLTAEKENWSTKFGAGPFDVPFACTRSRRCPVGPPARLHDPSLPQAEPGGPAAVVAFQAPVWGSPLHLCKWNSEHAVSWQKKKTPSVCPCCPGVKSQFFAAASPAGWTGHAASLIPRVRDSAPPLSPSCPLTPAHPSTLMPPGTSWL